MIKYTHLPVSRRTKRRDENVQERGRASSGARVRSGGGGAAPSARAWLLHLRTRVCAHTHVPRGTIRGEDTVLCIPFSQD